MNLDITEAAAEWYKDEFDISQKANLRLFVRYGGVGGLVPGFSIGINIEEPNQIYVEKTINNLTIYIEEKDAWYRSEEHTSELQSRFDLVCRLLLEKKKK